MPYPITLSDGITTLVSVPDLTILGPLEINAPSNCSINLVGRGAPNYGDAINTNFVWMLQHFASATSPTQPLAGQLWYNNTSGASSLNLFNSAGKWVQVATADSGFTMTGNLTVQDGLGDLVEVYGSGAVRLLRTNYQPHIVFEGMANCTNAVTLSLGTDAFGNPDLTIYSPVFSNVAGGFIWHSDNLDPFDLLKNNDAIGNNTFSGTNDFTGTTHFSEIMVDIANGVVNDAAYTAVAPGSLTLVNTEGGSPELIFASPNPASGDYAVLTFADPDVLMQFYSNVQQTLPGSYLATVPQGYLTFTPTTNLTGTNTVYHTGNLLPIIQNPLNGGVQTIAGSLSLSGGGGLTASGVIVGNDGASFVAPVTVGGSEVFTVAGGTIAGAVTINSLLTVTGGAAVTGGLTGDIITGTNGYVNIGALGNGNLIPQLGFYDTEGGSPANIFCDLTSPSNYKIGLSFNDAALVGSGNAVQTGVWEMTTAGNVYNTGNLSAQSDIISIGGSLVQQFNTDGSGLGVFGANMFVVSQSPNYPATINFGYGPETNSITGFTGSITAVQNTENGQQLVFVSGESINTAGTFPNGMMLDDVGDLTLVSSHPGSGNVFLNGGSFLSNTGSFYTSGGSFATDQGNFSTTNGNFSTLNGNITAALGTVDAQYMTCANSSVGNLTVIDGLTVDASALIASNLTVNGTIFGVLESSSDARLKSDIETLENALFLVGQLRGVRYVRTSTGRAEIGVIAQEVQPIVPELVSATPEGTLTMAYGNALALCINAINELRARVEQLEANQ